MHILNGFICFYEIYNFRRVFKAVRVMVTPFFDYDLDVCVCRSCYGVISAAVCAGDYRILLHLIFLYMGPYAAHARKSCPSLSMPNALKHDGRKMSSSGTLCMLTGMRSIEHIVIRSAPM